MGKKHISRPLLFSGILILVLVGAIKAFNTIPPQKTEKDDILTSIEVVNKELYKEIQDYGKENDIEPIDAKVDRVWKAIPGYNGKVVNVKSSYEKMLAEGKFDEGKIIYNEVAPNVHLEDLEPKPIYRGNPQKPMVAPLINVAWGNEYIPEILNALDDHQIKVTFFFDGSWVKKNPELAKTIKETGHEIGNHAYSHPDLSQYSTEQTTEEIRKTNEAIEETLGVRPKWFAPPSGSFNEGTIQVAHQLDMKTILWTVDTIDWRNPETWGMVKRVVEEVENGSMILMHPTKPTAEGLNTMITDIQEKGYKLGTVSDLMDEKRID